LNIDCSHKQPSVITTPQSNSRQPQKEAHRTIAVLSPDYFKSSFTKPEWRAAFAEDATGKARKLIPIRVRECDVEGMLRVRVYIDLVGKEKTDAKDELLRQIRANVDGSRLKPDAEPDFPRAGQRGEISPGCASLPACSRQKTYFFSIRLWPKARWKRCAPRAVALMSCAKSRTLPAINSKALPTFKRFN
jgi:hypothetical protein